MEDINIDCFVLSIPICLYLGKKVPSAPHPTEPYRRSGSTFDYPKTEQCWYILMMLEKLRDACFLSTLRTYMWKILLNLSYFFLPFISLKMTFYLWFSEFSQSWFIIWNKKFIMYVQSTLPYRIRANRAPTFYQDILFFALHNGTFRQKS